MDRNVIDDFETGGEKLAKAVRGLTPKELLWVPAPGAGIGRWSIQQIVMHLMDDELIWSSRMKRMIAEDNPEIVGFDESKYAAKLFYDQQDAQVAVQILDLNRRQLSPMFRKLPDEAFARTARHNDLGLINLGQSIVWTNEHLDHHILYIAMKRDRLGTPIEPQKSAS
jgi:hypothetical protein